jgi:hypothetical protein
MAKVLAFLKAQLIADQQQEHAKSAHTVEKSKLIETDEQGVLQYSDAEHQQPVFQKSDSQPDQPKYHYYKGHKVKPKTTKAPANADAEPGLVPVGRGNSELTPEQIDERNFLTEFEALLTELTFLNLPTSTKPAVLVYQSRVNGKPTDLMGLAVEELENFVPFKKLNLRRDGDQVFVSKIDDEANEYELDQKSLMQVLALAYGLEDDDLHRDNVGVVFDPLAHKARAVCIDHDMKLYRLTSTFKHGMREAGLGIPDHTFTEEGRTRVRVKDIEQGLLRLESDPHYWPTTTRYQKELIHNLTFGRCLEKIWTAEARAVFKQMPTAGNFKDLKIASHRQLLQQALLPEAVMRRAMELHLGPKELGHAHYNLINLIISHYHERNQSILVALLQDNDFLDDLKDNRGAIMDQIRAARDCYARTPGDQRADVYQDEDLTEVEAALTTLQAFAVRHLDPETVPDPAQDTPVLTGMKLDVFSSGPGQHPFNTTYAAISNWKDVISVPNQNTLMTPLCLAAEQGRLDVVKILVASNARSEKSADSPIFIAAKAGHYEVVRYLESVGYALSPDQIAILIQTITESESVALADVVYHMLERAKANIDKLIKDHRAGAKAIEDAKAVLERYNNVLQTEGNSNIGKAISLAHYFATHEAERERLQPLQAEMRDDDLEIVRNEHDKASGMKPEELAGIIKSLIANNQYYAANGLLKGLAGRLLGQDYHREIYLDCLAQLKVAPSPQKYAIAWSMTDTKSTSHPHLEHIDKTLLPSIGHQVDAVECHIALNSGPGQTDHNLSGLCATYPQLLTKERLQDCLSHALATNCEMPVWNAFVKKLYDDNDTSLANTLKADANYAVIEKTLVDSLIAAVEIIDKNSKGYDADEKKRLTLKAFSRIMPYMNDRKSLERISKEILYDPESMKNGSETLRWNPRGKYLTQLSSYQIVRNLFRGGATHGVTSTYKTIIQLMEAQAAIIDERAPHNYNAPLHCATSKSANAKAAPQACPKTALDFFKDTYARSKQGFFEKNLDGLIRTKTLEKEVEAPYQPSAAPAA